MLRATTAYSGSWPRAGLRSSRVICRTGPLHPPKRPTNQSYRAPPQSQSAPFIPVSALGVSVPGVSAPGYPRHELTVRNREAPLRIVIVAEARKLADQALAADGIEGRTV